MTIADDELERLYAGPIGPVPAGCLRGHFLHFLDTAGGRSRKNRAVHTVLFRWPRFGIDFERQLWWFIDTRIGAGRFRMDVGPSRWRDAEVLRLVYDVSRWPAPIRNVLYDEVKPLPDGRIIGIGGTNHDRDTGDHFWFELGPLGRGQA